MTLMDALSVLSFFVGIISIMMAIFALKSASQAEERSKRNFEDTQKFIQQFYDRTKETLNQVDKKSEIIQQSVKNSEEKLLNTLTEIVKSNTRRNDPEEQAKLKAVSSLFEDPSKLSAMMSIFKDIPPEFLGKNIDQK